MPAGKFVDYHKAAEELLGNKKLEKYSKAKISKMNPITYIDYKDLVFLIMHGTLDDTVPVEQSREFYNALKTAGVKVEYCEIKNGGHGGISFDSIALPKVSEFFKENLKN